MTTPRGPLITIDGPGGIGKSTALRATRLALEAAGHTVHTTTQPSASAYGKAVREAAQSMRGRALALAVAADRLHQLDTEIRPARRAARTVLVDRYLPSTLVLQRADGVSVDDILALNVGVDVPDLSVILLADAGEIMDRLAGRGTRHRFETDPASSQRELDLYREAIPVLQRLKYRILTIDATRLTPEGVARAIVGAAPAPTATVTTTTAPTR
ncbi:dTMP kinase [Streptomyces sp. NPDC001493]